jgi:hypothetical protein
MPEVGEPGSGDMMSRRSAPMLRLQVAAARYRFRESLFLLPTLVVLAGIALA